MKAGLAALALLMLMTSDMYACTGIWLVSRDGSRVVARTMDHDGAAVLWGYVISPRGHDFCSRTPDGENGLRYNAVYGFVGIYADDEAFVVEGMNEAGLSAGLFRCAEHYDFDEYESSGSRRTLCSAQLVSWLLSQFSTIDQIKDALEHVDIVTLDDEDAVCWRIAEPNGKMSILEIIDGRPSFHDSWISLCDVYEDPEAARADFIRTSAEMRPTGTDSVMQAFHILNNFEILDKTRFVSATDQTAMKLYYRTAWNSNIRCLDLMDIDFRKVRYQSRPLDLVRQQPVEMLKVR